MTDLRSVHAADILSEAYRHVIAIPLNTIKDDLDREHLAQAQVLMGLLVRSNRSTSVVPDRPMGRRIGKILMDRSMIQSFPPEVIQRAMEGVAIFHVEERLDLDFYQMAYFAECEEFELIPEGTTLPEYKMFIVYEGGVYLRREFHKQ